MPKTPLLMVLVLFCTQIFAQEPYPASDQTIQDSQLEEFVDGVIHSFRYVHSSPGYTVSVVRPDRTLFAKGYGFADLENQIPVDPVNTRFHIASISKTFVWTSAMILVDRGLLDLDADVNSYLKRYKVKEGEKPLTTNMLMAHKGGYEEKLEVFVTKFTALPIDEAIAQTTPKQVYPRGEVAGYSNWGSNLVTLIIEDITGQSYADFLYTELLNPLGMSTTHLNEQYPNENDKGSFIAENYFVKSHGPTKVGQIDMGSFAAVGGMTTTSVDMANWMRFHLNRGELNGVRILSKEAYQLMRTRVYDPVEGSGARVHGFGEMYHRGTPTYGHSGHINAFLSNFAIAPDLGLGVFVSQNMDNTREPVSALPALVFDRALAAQGMPDVLSRPIPSDEDIKAAKEVAGKYLNARRIAESEHKFISAIFSPPLNIRAKEGLLIIGNTKNAPYARIAEDLWENRLGYRFAVDRNADNSIKLLISPSGAVDFLPISFWTDPKNLLIVCAATVLLTLTTWIGFYRRIGHTKETNATGRVMSIICLLGIVPLIVLAVIFAQAPIAPGSIAFADAMQNWPLPIVKTMVLGGTVVSIFGTVLLLGLIPVWLKTQWKTWRRIHYSLYATFYAATSVLLINWGLI